MSVKRIGKSRYEVRCRYCKQNIKRKFDDKWEAQEFERLVMSDGMDPERAYWTARGFGKPKETASVRQQDAQAYEGVPKVCGGDRGDGNVPLDESA